MAVTGKNGQAPGVINFSSIQVLMVAKNAADTIARAIKSLPDTPSLHLILIDSSSTSATRLAVQEAISRRRLSLKSMPDTTPVGEARQAALDLCTVPYGIWLDADDAFAPHHIERHLNALEHGADYAICGVTLIDDHTDALMSKIDISADFGKNIPLVWCFERNWLPSLCSAFRLAPARKAGFDISLHGAEDYDHLLKRLDQGDKFTILAGTSYHYYHRNTSISRDLAAREQDSQKIAQKWVQHIRHKNSESARINILGGVDAALLEPAASLWLQAITHNTAGDQNACIKLLIDLRSHPDTHHPLYHLSLHGLSYFLQATQLLLNHLTQKNLPSSARQISLTVSSHPVHILFEKALNYGVHPALLNNQAVAHYHLTGQARKAEEKILEALKYQPHYTDASKNLALLKQNIPPGYITKRPMRPLTDRSQYSPK